MTLFSSLKYINYDVTLTVQNSLFLLKKFPFTGSDKILELNMSSRELKYMYILKKFVFHF